MPLDTQPKFIPFHSLIDVIGIADPSSTDVDLEFLNQVMELKRQKADMAERVSVYGGLSETKAPDLGVSDEMLEGLMWGSAGGGLPKTVGKKVAGVATNIFPPAGYTNKASALLGEIKTRPKAALKMLKDAILKDKPQYSISHDSRELPYRKMFGLEPRAGSEHFRKVADKTYTFNKSNPRGLGLHEEAIKNIKSSQYISPFEGGAQKADAVGGIARGHDVMGGFNYKTLPKGKVEYKDVWDFAINKNEQMEMSKVLKKLFSKKRNEQFDAAVYLQRMFMNAVSDPITIVGRGKL